MDLGVRLRTGSADGPAGATEGAGAAVVHIEDFVTERDVIELVNGERAACGASALQEYPAVRREHSEHLRDWLSRDDPDELYDDPDAAGERARAVRDLGVEVVHDRLACFDLELGDMLDPDVRVPYALTEAMVRSLLEGPSFAGPLRDPTATHVGLVVVHQSIATEPVSWTTWVGALLVRAGGPAPEESSIRGPGPTLTR